uniref:NHL repeat containing protein n=1 Tax=Solibacter usitatus (strain Ellin6076) TaxID=234267 RepID=Q01RF7_SOLUE
MHKVKSALLAAILLVVTGSLLSANDGKIISIVGAGQGGSLANSIPAASAQLVAPGGIWVDASNNVFIADSGNNRVVVVQYPSGILYQIAGNGTATSSGDGGSALQSSVNRPMGLAADFNGNLYISEFQGNRIRRIDMQTGMISTVAGTGVQGFAGDGGLAGSAQLSHPAGIAFDSAGNLYIADMGNFRIRRIDGQTGVITTIAGDGSNTTSPDGVLAAGAGLSQPIWVAPDRSGGLLVSEMGAMRIRRVDLAGGGLTTVAGNGNANFTGDGVPAQNAGIGGPLGLTVFVNGDVLFADGTGRVRRVEAATGLITTVAGNGTGPHGVSTAGGGSSSPSCYAAVIGDNGPATSATLDGPFGVLLTTSGNLLISDSLDCRVRAVNFPSSYPFTNTTLTSSATILQPNQTAVLTATVTPIGAGGAPTGTIQFVDASLGTVLGAVPLSGGTATFVIGAGNTGSRTVMAVYGGDAAFNGSGSPQITLSQSSASKIAATLTLSVNQNPSIAGTATVFTATVNPPDGATAQPTGPVAFYDGSLPVGTANLVNGVATLPVVFTSTGNHAMFAAYPGDNNYSQVLSVILTQPVIGAPPQVTVTSGTSNSTYGQPVQLTVSVVPASATGTIQLTVDQSPIPALTLPAGGVLVIPVPLLSAGTHTITAVYSGDGNYPAATSAPFIQTVAKATPLFTVTSSLNPSTAGQAVTLTVTMTPVSNGSGLDLQIGNPPASLQATWSAGQTSITTADLSIGTHTVKGVWGGDANVLAGSSAILTQTVQGNPSTTSLTASPNPSVYGRAVILTATVTPASATGLVAFNRNGVPLAVANIVSGQAQISIATLPVGSNSLTAAYAGDAINSGSTSPALTQVVTAAMTPTSVKLTSSANPSVAGRQLWITATVTPSAATGTIQFQDGATTLGTATLANGWATLLLSSPAVGTLSLTASYSGNINYLAGTSPVLTQTISPASPVVVTPAVISTLVGLPNGCAPGVSYCGIGHPVADQAGNLYFQDGYQILMRSPAGVVTAIAGNGQPGSAGDGGPALSASIGASGQLTVHGSRVCFGERFANKVRCVDISTGLIQGYGTGTQASSGDGGNVSAASFYAPSGGVFDDAGNFYIAEFGRDSVRRIDAVTSIVTTVAGPGPGYGGMPLGDGGPAVGANLLSVGDLAYYSGSLYIADSGNGRVRKVDLTTGMISSVASTSARYIAIDQSGNLFYNSGLTVNMMDASGSISTIANADNYSGIGTDDILAADTVFGGMAGLGWDSAAQRLMIADQSRLRQVFFTPPTTTALTLSPNPGTPGGQVALTAVVTPATATGSVRFYQDYLLLGSASIAGGAAGFTWVPPIGGNPTAAMRAVYGGDLNNNLSISPTVTATIRAGSSPSSLVLTSNLNPSLPGSPVTLTAAVSPGGTTGSVAFYSNGALQGTAPLVSGQAQWTMAALPAGSYILQARYGGDVTYAGSFSSMVTQKVAPAVTVALTSSVNPSVAGQPVSFTAALTPSTASGTVQFLDGATLLGTGTIASGVAAITVSALPVGTHSITAVYGGDANNVGATSAVLTQTVNKAASTVSLASSTNPATAGQSITLTATVTPATATGTVRFVDGSTVLGTAPVTGGSANFSISTLTTDTHSITAVYSGDGDNADSTSTPLSQVVKATVTVALTYSANPATLGEPLTLSATISPAAATGTVQFLDGVALLGTVPVTGGVAVLSISNLTAGQHSINVVYGGDATYFTATAGAGMQVKTGITITLSVSPNPPVAGQTVTFTAAMSPAAATGTVRFADWSGAQLGAAPISAGIARLVVTPQTFAYPAGAQKIMASYDGDATYMYGTATLNMNVAQAPTSVALTSSLNPSTSGQSVTFTAVVSPATAGGSVQFLDGSTVLASAAVNGGTALLSLSTLSAGAHSITAAYSGDTNNVASTSAVISQTVSKVTASVALVASQNPALFGQNIPLSATVMPGSASGSVQFLDGTTVLGTASLADGTAAISISTLAVGQHAITAVYSGDAQHTGATSTVVTETINMRSSTVIVTSSLNPSQFGQAINFSAAVTPATATGTVQFLDGSTLLGTAILIGGAGSITTSTLAPGNHSITAVYSGDGSTFGSTSAVLTQTVNKAPSAVTVVSSANPAVVGSTVTFTASLTHTPGSATGGVQFLDGSTVLGTVTLSSGTAALTTSSLAAGSHTITAAYSGDVDFVGSSASLNQSVLNSTSTSLTADHSSTTYGQTITFTATLSPSTATGTVTFLDGGSVIIGSATVSGGHAKLVIATLPAGSHSITASYGGDAADFVSSSAALSLTVAQVKPSVNLAASPSTAVVGQTVTLTVAISANAATGTVTFNDGTQPLGTAPVSNGAAVFSTTALAAGNHAVTAVYSGDLNYTSVTSNKVNVNVKVK